VVKKDLVILIHLSKDPEDRCKDVAEMLEKLRKVQSGYIDANCQKTFLKGRIFRYMRWLDENQYPHVITSYLLAMAFVLGLIGFGVFLGRL
jgi:hypothetical protein